MKKFPVFSIVIAVLFIVLGSNLITKQDALSVAVGYACILFFSGLILFTTIRLLSRRNKSQ